MYQCTNLMFIFDGKDWGVFQDLGGYWYGFIILGFLQPGSFVCSDLDVDGISLIMQRMRSRRVAVVKAEAGTSL